VEAVSGKKTRTPDPLITNQKFIHFSV